MQPIISFVIPSYNCAVFLNKVLSELEKGNEEIEAIIVNDGSKDGTIEIVKTFIDRKPNIFKLINQENKGHGGAINTGIEASKGLYVKVIDADDWVNIGDIITLLNTIKRNIKNNINVDLYISNYVYEHVLDNSKLSVSYRKYLPKNKIFGWNDIKKFNPTKFLMMHSLLYKKDVLIKSELRLPEHCFYVDNFFAYKPLAFVKDMCYLDIDFYHYFIGREDQSMNQKNFINRYAQQNIVTKAIFDCFSFEQIKNMEKGLKNYLFHEGGIMLLGSCLTTTCGKDNIKDRKLAWKSLVNYFKKKDIKLYRKFKYKNLTFAATYIPFWNLRCRIMLRCYKLSQKIFKIG